MRIIVLTVFNPAFPDQILVQFGDRLNIYHSPDFTLLKEIKREDEMTLEDIDPSTGNLLFYNSKEAEDCRQSIRTGITGNGRSYFSLGFICWGIHWSLLMGLCLTLKVFTAMKRYLIFFLLPAYGSFGIGAGIDRRI